MFSTEFLDIPPLVSADGTVTLPGSKSISNRVLLLSALSHGSTVIHDLLDSDDTRVMLDALTQLGCGVTANGSTVTVAGLGGRLPRSPARLFLGNAGTAMRPADGGPGGAGRGVRAVRRAAHARASDR